MNLDQIETKCFILALFIRDDGERFLLGSRAYEFVDSQLHFTANAYQNDIVEVQGNDGVMLAGQVRRGQSQAFDGYIGDSSVDRSTIEQYRQNFLKFFRKNHYYKVVYIFTDGSAIQRRQGFIVEAPEVKELYQLFPQYHISMNFEDINYYEYKEDEDGQEIYGESATLKVATAATGGLIWEDGSETTLSGEGSNFTLNGTIDGNGISNVQLKGDTYQDGTPTPDAPIPVQTVTGRQTVTITDGGEESQEYEVNLGKNLFNNNVSPVTYGGNATAESISTGIRVSMAGSSGTNRAAVYKILDTADYIGKTITFSTNMAASGSNNPRAYIGLAAADGSNRVGKATLNASGSVSYTVEEDANRPALVVVLYATGTNYGQVGDYCDYTNLQLEIGSTATTYAPYFEPIELCKLGTYQDYIYKSGSDWYVRKEIGKIIFIGTESWSLSGQPTNYLFNIPLPLSLTGTGRPLVSDRFIWNGTSSTSQQNVIYINSSGRIVFINPISAGTTVASNLDDWKTWLVSHNTTVYYPLATPTDTQITNTALIAQLNALAGATTYDGQTVFTVSSPNQLAILSLSTIGVDGGGVMWDEYGAEWEEGTGGGPTTITVDSIDNVYPVWTVTGPAVNPQISVLTTNTTLSYSGTVTSSQELKIDMFNKTATLNGASVVGNVSGDWVYLKPGVNRITYTTNNADAPDSTIWWQEIVG